MLYLRYLILLFFLSVFSQGYSGVFNTQTNLTLKVEQAEKKLEEKKKKIDEEIDKYKKSIKESNESIKESIKLLNALVEIKKDTLMQIKHETKLSNDIKEKKWKN